MKKLLLIILIFGLCSLMTPAQNVGVSDAAGLTPQCLLHIHKNSSAASTLLQATNIVSGNGSGKGFTLDVDGSFNVTLNNRMNTSLGFNTNGTQKMIILNNGNVGIGTASPGQKLDVNGNIKLGDNMMVEGNTAWRVYRNLATYDNSNSAAAGAFVITTAQPWNSACMFRVKLEGYFYDNTAPFELTIGAYIYTNNSFYNYGYINIGAKIMNVRLARNITTNTVTIIIGDESGSYSYPKISVTSFTQGHSGINESYADGWTITQETSLSNYDFIHTVPNVTTLPATSPNYIQNQDTADQAANFRITGTGRANTSFYAPLYTGAGNIAIRPGANSTTAIQLQNTGGTSILNVDATNNNVGIGTTTPSDKLHVNGNVRHNGSMVSQGANYTSTWMQFDQDVYGNSLILGSGGLTTLGAGESANLVRANTTPGTETLYLSSDGGINLITSLQSDWASRIDAMTILTNGNVGIGTTSPSARLHTTGTVRLAGYPSGANGAIVRTDDSGNLAITNFTGNTTDILLGNNTFGTVAAAGGVTSSCGTQYYVPKMSSSTAMTCSQIYDNGTNVGIGTTTLPQKLSVEGGIHVKDGNYLDFVNWQWAMGRDINSTFSTGNELQVLGYGSSGNSFQIIGITGSSPSYTYSRIFQANLDNGNVGIGTSPTARLDINGDLKINSQSSTQKRHISTITRSIGGSAGDYVYLGTITSNGAGTYASIRQSHHFCGTINAAAYEITDVYYSGTTTDWIQVPTQNYRSYSGNQDFSIDVRRSASHPTTLEVRARNLGGPCGGGSIDFEIQTNGTFTASTTSGSGASVAGFLSNNAYQFPVSNNLFKASTDGIFILNSGNVGIGTTSPTAQLHTTGTVRLANYPSGSYGAIVRTDGSGNLATTNFTGNTTDILLGNNTFGTIATAGGVTSSCGTPNYVPKMSSSTAMNCSQIYDNGTNVGIGTTTPSEKLHINGGSIRLADVAGQTPYEIRSYSNASSLWFIAPDLTTSKMVIGTAHDWDRQISLTYTPGTTGSAAGELSIGQTDKNNTYYTHGITRFLTNGSEKMRIIANGNVGIGTTAPSAKLHLEGNAYITTYLGVGASPNTSNRIYATQDAGSPTIFGYNSYGSTSGMAGVAGACSNTGTGYLGYYDGTNRAAVYGTQNGTSTNYWAGYFNGNSKTSGYIVAGAATTSSTTRYGTYNLTWNTGLTNADGGYVYSGSIGTIPIPAGASSITITKIVWECDAAHEDGNEDHGIWVGVGSSAAAATYYGWWASVNNGYHFIDWHRVDIANQYAASGSNYIYIRTYDESCCNSDYLTLYNMNMTIYYSYTIGLQPGDIAASGRVYANNTTAIGDLAEHFEYTGPVNPGYVVSLVPGSENEYVPCSEPYSNYITGVLSENPSVVLNSPKQGPPVALAGRVKVKLIKSDVPIKSGDFVTSSDQPGLAQKALHPGPVIGYAVMNQKPDEDFVEVLLQLGKYYIPPAFINDDFDNDNSLEKPKGKR